MAISTQEIPYKMNELQNDLQKLQKKIYREKERYCNLLDKYKKLQSSQLTGKLSQLVLDPPKQEDHSKREELQTFKSLDSDTIAELIKLKVKMEDVSVSLEKANAVKKHWMEQRGILRSVITL